MQTDPLDGDDRLDYLRSLVLDVADFPEPGIVFRDISPLIADGDALQVTIAELEARTPDSVTTFVGVEARGFIFASALAARMGRGFVPVRKPGKLPRAVDFEDYALEYGPAGRLEIHQDALGPDAAVVIVDDVLATGGTAAATARLVERSGAKLLTALFVIELVDLHGRDRLNGLEASSLLKY